MNIKEMIKKGLLGYQPIFFPNGLITGTGYQFFGNLLGNRVLASSNEQAFKESRRLGNLYIPTDFGNHSEFDSEFYYCVDESELEYFAKYNLVLLQMYKHFTLKSLELASNSGCTIESMIEVGSNTCLFPLTFAEIGVKFCHGADIVDYSEVVDLLSAMKKTEVSFHHMLDDSDETWKKLPKTDLVWSYAVLLHQSNPLVHLTRLASLAKKAIFMMTLCDPNDWKSDEEMAIRYLSVNSYYNADFPNCFDVTVVSPALIKYSLKRLGFSRIIEVPYPEFKMLDETSRSSLQDWQKKHGFFLAFRDTPKGESALNDFSVSTERSPFKGENVLVYSGYHNNVILGNSRYYIVPQGIEIAGNGADHQFQSFANLNNAMQYFHNLEWEKNPQPLLIGTLKNHNLVRFKNKFYLCVHGLQVNFENSDELLNLPVLDSLEKWVALLALLNMDEIYSLEGVIVDFLEGMCIIRTQQGLFKATQIKRDGVPKNYSNGMCSHSLKTLVKKITTESLLDSLDNLHNSEVTMFKNDAISLKRIAFNVFQIQCAKTETVISEHPTLEEAWNAVFASLSGVR